MVVPHVGLDDKGLPSQRGGQSPPTGSPQIVFIHQMVVLARGSSKCVERNRLSGQAGSDLIKDCLLDEEPVMIARLGRTELHCLAKYLTIHADESVVRKS